MPVMESCWAGMMKHSHSTSRARSLVRPRFSSLGGALGTTALHGLAPLPGRFSMVPTLKGTLSVSEPLETHGFQSTLPTPLGLEVQGQLSSSFSFFF